MSKANQKQPSAHSLFATDKNLESEKGVSLDYPGFSVVIHRAGGTNKKFAQVLQSKMKPHLQRFQRGTLDEETSQRIMIETYAESVIVGWSGNIGPGGKKSAFSVDNCIKVLTELPDLFEDIKAQANAASTFRGELEEIEEKN